MKDKHSNQFSSQVNSLLPVYFTCLDHESAVSHSHQNTLLTLQVGLLGIQFISSDDMSSFWILAFVGVALCFLLGPLYEYRVINVDFWRSEIVSLIHGSKLENTF